jgi:hypothetical protein
MMLKTSHKSEVHMTVTSLIVFSYTDKKTVAVQTFFFSSTAGNGMHIAKSGTYNCGYDFD